MSNWRPSRSCSMRRRLLFSRRIRSICFSRSCTCLMLDMRRLVSLVNWHFTLRLEHSEQLVVSVASHLTFLSRQASQLGSFLRCRYARFWPWPGTAGTAVAALDRLALLAGACDGSWAWAARGVPATESLDGRDSRSMTVADDVAVPGV